MKRRLPRSRRERGLEVRHLKLLRFVIFILLALVFLSPARAEVLKTLSGRVLAVDAQNNLLNIDFQHPATGERKELVFVVTAETGFRGIKTLSQLRHDDPVTIDYEENSQGSLQARQISKVRLTGPPPGAENFHGF